MVDDLYGDLAGLRALEWAAGGGVQRRPGGLAYFTGADDPYDKLKRALRAEVDVAAWASLYSITSRPFERPKTGKIAVKVINHYGDEVLKVFRTE